jgi:hypothetical protein
MSYVPPIPVVAISSNERHVFSSIAAAAKWLIDNGHQNGDHRHNIRRKLDKHVEYFGYMWEKHDGSLEGSNTEDGSDGLRLILEYANNREVFLRTTNETPKRVSVYDLISAICETDRPHETYYRLGNTYPDVYTFTENLVFPGVGQRPTPVVDARGLVYLMNILQGPNAANFRLRNAEFLVRFIGGDLTLIDDIYANARTQQALPANHPMRMFGEIVEVNTSHDLLKFISPTMEGKYLDDFHDRNVVYLVTFADSYIKFGKSEDSWERMKTHIKTYPNVQLYCMYVVTHMKRVEDMFKSKMRSRGLLRNIRIAEKTYTEVVTNIDAESAESLLCDIIDSVDQGDYTRIRLKELDMEQMQIEKDIKLQKMELVKMFVAQGMDVANIKELLQAL